MKKENFKYYEKIQALDLKIECPMIIEEDFEIEAYRYTYNKKVDSIDCLPQALKPGRPLRKLGDYETKICNDYAISLFNDEEKAKEYYSGLNKRTKELLGYKYIAKGVINNRDGYCTEVEKTGHFNLHELKNCSLENKFVNINEL